MRRDLSTAGRRWTKRLQRYQTLCGPGAGRGANPGHTQPIDGAAGEAQHPREQGDGTGQHQEHGRDGPDGNPVHERHAEEHQPEERDHHGATSEQDRSSRRVDGVHHRSAGLCAVAQRLPVASHDEERVVDTHPEADHGGERGTERRHDEAVAHQRHHRVADADPEQCGDDREPHGDGRPEGDEQYDDGGRDPDELCGCRVWARARTRRVGRRVEPRSPVYAPPPPCRSRAGWRPSTDRRSARRTGRRRTRCVRRTRSGSGHPGRRGCGRPPRGGGL